MVIISFFLPWFALEQMPCLSNVTKGMDEEAKRVSSQHIHGAKPRDKSRWRRTFSSCQATQLSPAKIKATIATDTLQPVLWGSESLLLGSLASQS